MRRRQLLLVFGLLALAPVLREARADETPSAGVVRIDGGPGWQTLTVDDFEQVNCDLDTWSMRDGEIYCTGKPVGVTRSKSQYTNLELSVEWQHLKKGGNSGLFLWATPKALENLPSGALPPGGIEIQVLENGFTELYEQNSGKKGDWFTTHGDVFPVGQSKMTPFPPLSPNGSRSFPSKHLSKPMGEWNYYYVRAIDGEIRLWVNGEEVSGGRDCSPASGYLCLESEGAPVKFRNLKVRELP